MLFTSDEMVRVLGAIRAGARQWTADELKAVLKAAKERKEPGFDQASVASQHRYKGRQRDAVAGALAKRFPNTPDMPVAAINWMQLIARLDAGVYVVPPDRFLEEEDGTRVENDDPRGKLWQWALRKARFHAQMAEAERRALIPPGVVVGQVVWLKPPGDPVGYPRIDLYWPHHVEVICHPMAPTSFEFAYVVAMRQASPDPSSKGEWYRVWSREPPDHIDGEWGRWTCALVSTEGDQVAEVGGPENYEGSILPVFLLQLSDPEGFPFSLRDTDLIDIVDDLNERRSNESYVIGLQGHNQLWTDDVKEMGQVKTGPDSLLQVMPGSQVGVLSYNPALSDMRESRKLALRELAISRGNAPDAYTTEPGQQMVSGVAKRIQNLTHDTRVAEQALLMQDFEEREALRVLLDVMQAFHPQGSTLDGLTPRMTPRRLPTFEDPSQKQLRLESAVKAGWIAPERAAADAEFYSSVDEATKAMAKLEAQAPPPAPLPVPIDPPSRDAPPAEDEPN